MIFAHPRLIFWSILPIGITLGLYFYVITTLQALAHAALTGYLASWGWNAEGWAAWTLTLLTKILLLMVSAMTFSIVASLAASPFNDFLAENTERWAQPALPPVKRASVWAKVRLILIDVLKTLAATVATIAAVLMSWVPVLNIFAFLLAFLLICFQYTSYPQTRRGIGVGGGLKFLWRHLFACAGFGAVLSVLFAIPLVASFTVPIAVVGGTLLAARAPGRKPELAPLK